MAKIEVNLLKITKNADRRINPAGNGGFADEMELIRHRAQILSGTDRALVLLHLDKGRQYAEVAHLMGVCEATVARRVGRIIRRLMDGQYIAILRRQGHLSLLERDIARDYFLDALSINAIAEHHKISVYQVRKALAGIRRLVDETSVQTSRLDRQAVAPAGGTGSRKGCSYKGLEARRGELDRGIDRRRAGAETGGRFRVLTGTGG
ncbi:MAG: hypothetical protein IH624_05230 [Phycisphaerae bacterium]|nr:hypothetical protein [Phycisphaerae bacterium]